MKIAAVVVVAVVLAASGPALAPNSATGTFDSKDVKFALGGAIAFNAPSILDESQPAIFVAVSNRPLVPTLGDYIDRRRAIETLVKNDSTAIVYFLFTPQGRFRGLSYYFESGNGCGFCGSEVASTVTLANGRLAGNLKGTEKGRPFDVTFDVAIMNDDHGAALPTGGGAPGNAYLASCGAPQA